MEGRLVLKRCALFRADGRVRDDMALVIEGDRIARVAPNADVPVLPGDWEVDCRGRLVSASLVDTHTHLVSGQLAPISGEWLMKDRRARFETQLALEAELTVGEVEALTAHALAKNLRAGVALSVEHLHAPRAVAGALRAQAEVAVRLGARLVNSHATMSRSFEGAPSPLVQAEANAAHAREHRKHPLVRSALGFHASATCDDELLRRLGRWRDELGVGAQYHLAETDEDLAITYERHRRRIVQRLESFGLLGPGTVGAYARTIDRSEADRLARARTLLSLSPQSAISAELLGSGFDAVLEHQHLVGLGTSGVGSLWDELSLSLLFVMQLAQTGRVLDPDALLADLLIGGPAELCTMLFGLPSGALEEGSLADVNVYDWACAASPEEVPMPRLLELKRAPVAWCIVGGRVTVREGRLLGADELKLGREADAAVRSVRARVLPGTQT